MAFFVILSVTPWLCKHCFSRICINNNGVIQPKGLENTQESKILFNSIGFHAVLQQKLTKCHKALCQLFR